MECFESSTNSFVVKIWIESHGDARQKPLWRGHITHVPSNSRQYVSDLDSITGFIAAYLQEMGVEGEAISKGVKGWLRKRSV
jgi:hypothetical protein